MENDRATCETCLVLLVALIMIDQEAPGLGLILSVLEAAINVDSNTVALVLVFELVQLAGLDEDGAFGVACVDVRTAKHWWKLEGLTAWDRVACYVVVFAARLEGLAPFDGDPLVLDGGRENMDCVALVDENHG